ncbi:MAG: NAD(+) synthase [Blastocatellia bacterium]|nr:NAD(+) synthase [Blastocatellia bacterium]
MKLITVGGAALNQTPMAWNQNVRNILRAIELAKEQKVSILCLPELCVTGYGCEDAYHSLAVIEMAQRLLFEEILPHTRGILVSIGIPVVLQNGIFNTVGLLCDGKLLGLVAKQHLAGDGIHYEPRWFKPWPGDVQTEITLYDGKSYPIGDLFFDISGVRIGYEICEDAWVARRPGGDLALKGVDIILNPSASHFAFGKHEIRTRFVLEGSRAFGVTYIYANLLGCESGRAIFDGGVLIATGGNLIARGKRMSFEDVVLTATTIDISQTRMSQSRTASFHPDLKSFLAGCVKAEFQFPRASLGRLKASDPVQPWENSDEIKKEEFTRAVSLALFDYMRKSHSKGFIISLSGGADSCASAVLVSLMIEVGTGEIGKKRFLEKIPYFKALDERMTVRQMTEKMLTCVYQATANSGEVTRNAAAKIAEAVGAEYYEFNIQTLVDGYTRMVSDSLGRQLKWETDDLALQNVQARVRAPGVWLLANVKGALLLTTSNRSEAAVGYATMDGDTCGGLCPIGGIDKAFLREWLRWMEKQGPSGLFPMPALNVVNEQQPTAELKPKEFHQTDEADLMPYPVLDAIERAAIRDKMSPREVYKLMQHTFATKHSNQELSNWVTKFFRLWSINQWKRERYAPSFHLDDENLDPKTWCRFPILSGGFERELEELHELTST